MQANVGRETTPEATLRRALFAQGLRYRRDVRPETDLRCAADVVFRSARMCVFVDGCFWHGCPTHFHAPLANRAWWIEKIEATRERDRRQTNELERRGWRVLRVWEHEIADLDAAVQRVTAALRPKRAARRNECHQRCDLSS